MATGIVFIAAGLVENVPLAMVAFASMLVVILLFAVLLWRLAPREFRRPFAVVTALVVLTIVGVGSSWAGMMWLTWLSMFAILPGVVYVGLGRRLAKALSAFRLQQRDDR